MNKRIKNIIESGRSQGWSKENIITRIMFEIASKEELELLFIWCDTLDCKDNATKLYNDYMENL